MTALSSDHLEGGSTLVPGLTLKDVGRIFHNKHIVNQFVREGKLVPVIKGGRGRKAIFDPSDVQALWERLKSEAQAGARH